MNNDERKAVASGTGREIRAFLTSAADPHSSTSRAHLTEMLNASSIPAEHHERLIERYAGIAKRARADGANVWELKGEAGPAAVDELRQIRAADDLTGEHGIPETTDAARHDPETADRVWGALRGESEHDTARRREATAERDRLSKLGIKVS